MTWTGTEDDRQHVVGQTVSYALSGPAEHVVARLQQIIASHPDIDPRDLMTSCMVHVVRITDEQREADLQERAEATAKEAAWTA